MAICRNPNCEQENAENLIYCKYCGRRLKEPKDNSKKPMMILIGVGLIAMVAILAKVLFSGNAGDIAKVPQNIKNKITQNQNIGQTTGVTGYRFAFIKPEGSTREVYMHNPDGTIAKVTTSNAINSYSSLAPDGSKIAFERKDGNVSNIYVININGTGEKKLAIGHQPTWSIDSKTVLFYNKSEKIASNVLYSINADGTGQKEMTATSDNYNMARYSPDGSKIAISKESLEGWGIYTVGPDLSGRKTLSANPKQEGEPVWSSDGSKVAFVSQRDGNSEIYIVDLNKNVLRLTNNPLPDMAPSFTADGKIIFTREEMGSINLYIIDNDGKNEKQLLKDAGFASVIMK